MTKSKKILTLTVFMNFVKWKPAIACLIDFFIRYNEVRHFILLYLYFLLFNLSHMHYPNDVITYTQHLNI